MHLPYASGMTSDARIAEYQKLLKTDPGNPHLQIALAEAFIRKLRETTDFAYLNHASAIVDKLLAADPKNYDAIRLSTEIETHRHNFPRAAELAAALAARNPSDSGALGLLGDSLMELGQYDAAGDAYRHMLTLNPNLASYNRVAYHSFVTGNSGEALAWMSTAVTAGSPSAENTAWCLVEFGDMLIKTGRIADARIAYEKALETLPGYHRAYAGLGRLLAATGEFAKAAEDFEKAQAVIPLPDYVGPLVSVYLKLGKPALAKKQADLLDVIDKLGRVNGERGNRALAMFYADENRNLDRALELARGEMEMRKDVYAWDALSWVLFRNGKQQEAADASRKAMATHTPEPLFLYHAGLIALGGGQTAQGKNFLRQALELNPDFSFPQASEARRMLDQAPATAPDAAKSSRNSSL